MINLLPPEEKEKILKIIKKRLAVIYCFFGFFLLYSFFAVLFLVNSYIKNEIEIHKIMLQTKERGYQQMDIGQMQEEINLANAKILKINNFYSDKIYFVDVLEKISSLMPDGISLNSISVSSVAISSQSSSGKESYKFFLEGFASKRETLFQFKKNFEPEDYFKNVNFPTSSWVKPSDIDFTVSFEINK